MANLWTIARPVMGIYLTKLYWLALGLFSLGVLWAGASVLNQGYHAAELRTIWSSLSPKPLRSISEAHPGDIAIVEDVLSVKGLSLPPDEPAFGNVSGVEKVLERAKSNGKWELERRTIWLPAKAWVGDFAIDQKMLKEPQIEAVAMEPGKDFEMPVWPNFSEVVVKGRRIEYKVGTEKKRVSYRVWPAGLSVSVLAKVDDTGKALEPFLIQRLNTSFWMMRPSGLSSGALVENEISRDINIGYMHLGLFAFCSYLFWCCLLARERRGNGRAVTLRALGPPLTCSVPLFGYLQWPMTAVNFMPVLLACFALIVLGALVSGSLTWKYR